MLILLIHIELQEANEEKHKTIDFIYSAITQFYYEMKELEQTAEKNLNQLIIEKNIEICKKYTFKEGSQLFGECILLLIEREKEKN
tara:strand:- start:123 stop:380 length:258 start_codon:yes stop_codon:yes gene_type:complete